MLNEIWTKSYIKKTQKNENDDDIYILYNIYISGVVSGGYARIIIIWDICCIVTLTLCLCV